MSAVACTGDGRRRHFPCVTPASGAALVLMGANCVFYTHAHIPVAVLGLPIPQTLSLAFPPPTNYFTRVRTQGKGLGTRLSVPSRDTEGPNVKYVMQCVHVTSFQSRYVSSITKHSSALYRDGQGPPHHRCIGL